MSQIRNLDLIVHKILKEMPISLDLSKNAAVVPIIEKYVKEAQEYKAEAQEYKAEAQEYKAETEKIQAQQRKSILLLHKEDGFSIEKIAKKLTVSEEYVQKVIRKN